MFTISLPRTRITRIGLISLETLASVFVSFLFTVKFLVCEHNMPCALAINSNSGFEREHVESCSSTTKKIISPLRQCLLPITTKFGRVLTHHEGLAPIKLHDSLIMWSSEIMWQTKTITPPPPHGLCLLKSEEW